MTWWQIILLIITIGGVSMANIMILTLSIGDMLDKRLKTKAAIEYRLSKTALNNITTLVNECFEKYMNWKDSKTPGYKVKPVVPINKRCEDDSFDDIELPSELK